jgi:menaquinone-dependent protoporphyrinogen oxidase
METDVRPADHRIHVNDYDAVIIGGALYTGRWHRHARRFVKVRRRVARPTGWLLSSGPLDDSASTTEIPPVPQVRRAIDRIGARGNITFGGRLLPDAKGFPASAMAKRSAGDWRDPARVRSWVTAVAADLRRGPQAGWSGRIRSRRPPSGGGPDHRRRVRSAASAASCQASGGSARPSTREPPVEGRGRHPGRRRTAPEQHR